jgi:hypothetical protein
VNISNKQLRTVDKGWSSSLGVGGDAKNISIYKIFTQAWTDSLIQPKQ